MNSPEPIGHSSCAHQRQPLGATDAVRWRDGFIDVSYPAVPLPSQRVWQIAGEDCLRRLVSRHHERLRASALGSLFPADPVRFALIVAASTAYVLEATGGPQSYSPGRESTCMRSFHFRTTIDERGREIWLAELLLSFDEVGFPAAVREETWNWLESMSLRIVNRRTNRDPLRRHPLAEAHASLREAMHTRRRPVMCPR